MSERGSTRVFAGIDEAGLGPLLGPLTLGWSAFRVPRDHFSLWESLSKVVSARPADDAQHVIVADSKRVFSRNPRGARRLETTALAFLDQLSGERPKARTPRTLFTFAPQHLRPTAALFERHPWYHCLPRQLPYELSEEALEIRSFKLARELERKQVQLVDAGLCAVPAGALNDSWRRTENKTLSQWEITGAIIRDLWHRFGSESLSVFVDRLGGRRRYRPLLASCFPDAAVEVRDESPGLYEYVLTGSDRRMRVAFAERGEERSFSVALGSCLAKYARELCMTAFNRYFGDLQPGLRPTAGYTTDGRRWLAEARETLERAGVPTGSLIRQR